MYIVFYNIEVENEMPTFFISSYARFLSSFYILIYFIPSYFSFVYSSLLSYTLILFVYNVDRFNCIYFPSDIFIIILLLCEHSQKYNGENTITYTFNLIFLLTIFSVISGAPSPSVCQKSFIREISRVHFAFRVPHARRTFDSPGTFARRRPRPASPLPSDSFVGAKP